jgi:adhesin transport system membrane fusion protein
MLRRPFVDGHRYADFLPDAEGLVERRHSPAAGLLIVAVAAVFGGLVGWAGLTEVEQVVRAEGQVEPAGRVKVVNHPDGGRIAAIHVAEGDAIAAGQPLVTFDGELIQTEFAELTGRWQVKAAEAARLRAEATGEEPVFEPELQERPHLVRQQQQLLEMRRAAHASRVETLMQTAERRNSEVESLSAELNRFRSSQGLVGKEVTAVRTLAEKGLYPRLRLVALERELSDVVGNTKKAEARLAAAEAAVGEAESQRRSLERERLSSVLSELAEAEAERDRLAEARRRAEALLRNMVVRAPVDGIVQELAVTTPGQSVGSNQPIMKLVPTGGGLVIEARVDNQDVGYVRVGQDARVKVRAFDFLRYGTLAGRVERIAADATVDPESGTYPYRIVVHTEAADLGEGEHRLAVAPGMIVDVDLLVGERTILSYLTDRILRLREDAFRDG